MAGAVAGQDLRTDGVGEGGPGGTCEADLVPELAGLGGVQLQREGAAAVHRRTQVDLGQLGLTEWAWSQGDLAKSTSTQLQVDLAVWLGQIHFEPSEFGQVCFCAAYGMDWTDSRNVSPRG